MNLKGDTLGSASGLDYTGHGLSEPGNLVTIYTDISSYSPEEFPPTETRPQCLAPPCHARKIRAKFYVNDELWDQIHEDEDLDLEKQVTCRLPFIPTFGV